MAKRTALHQRHRLFFGVCAHDAAETVARIGIRFQEEQGRPPSKREIVEAYYGEWIEPVDLFIGFADRPAVFDMPLIATGSEDLYFTVSPSLYLDAHTLRLILYDHMFARRVDDADYGELSPTDWQALAELYTRNRNHVLGLGRRDRSGSFWYPVPQVDLPPEMTG
jgi:tuberculosinol/isotuberculosinol synthase